MMKHANIFWRRWQRLRRPGTWSRTPALWASWLLTLGAYCAELPPAPPGFPGTTAAATPKAAELKASLGQSMTPILKPGMPLVTTHAPPVAMIEWRTMPQGWTDLDPSKTNPVPIRAWAEPAAPTTSLRIEFLAQSNQVYDVQCKLGRWAWMTVSRVTMLPKDDIMTMWCPIIPEEPVGLVRVMK